MTEKVGALYKKKKKYLEQFWSYKFFENSNSNKKKWKIVNGKNISKTFEIVYKNGKNNYKI